MDRERQGPLPPEPDQGASAGQCGRAGVDFVFLRHDSAKQASLMALAAPSVQLVPRARHQRDSAHAHLGQWSHKSGEPGPQGRLPRGKGVLEG